jgi:hypothetical protein
MNYTPTEIDLLDALEDMARQHCFIDKQPRVRFGVSEVNVTVSGALTADADALRVLAKHGRFRIVREGGRMVVGFWPEHDPEKATPQSKQPQPKNP